MRGGTHLKGAGVTNPETPGGRSDCYWCGYDLTDLTETGECPECGRNYKRGEAPADLSLPDAQIAAHCGIAALLLVWIPPISLNFAVASIIYDIVILRQRVARRGGWACSRPILIARLTGWPALIISIFLLARIFYYY